MQTDTQAAPDVELADLAVRLSTELQLTYFSALELRALEQMYASLLDTTNGQPPEAEPFVLGWLIGWRAGRNALVARCQAGA